jgi:hypothetical protein
MSVVSLIAENRKAFADAFHRCRAGHGRLGLARTTPEEIR